MGRAIDFYNYFENMTDDELKVCYQQYKEFQQTGVIPVDYELRKAADIYIDRISGAWTVPFTQDLLGTIADRWTNKKKFNPGDRVYHKNLKLEGKFLEYAWESDDEADVEFVIDGEIEQRHVSINQLVKL